MKTRSRIEVGPTGVAYLVVTGMTLGAAVYTQANMMFLALGLLAGGLVASLLWLWVGMRGLTIERLSVAHGVSGEELVLHYQLEKRSRVPAFSLVVSETWGRGVRGFRYAGPMAERPRRLHAKPAGWVMHLGGGQSCQAQASCWPARRGTLVLERIELATDFPFGILRRVVSFDAPDELLVLPRIRRMTRQVLSAITRLDAGGYNHLDKEGGSEEFYSLRKYRKGDSLKVIDWKHSAKTNKLLSRELTQPIPPTLTILLDLSAYAPPAGGGESPKVTEDVQLEMDRAVALTASLVCDAYVAGYRVGLTVSGAAGEPLRPHRSLPHRTRLLETLANLEAGSAPALQRFTGDAPSVIVRPGGGNTRAIRAGRRALELFGDDLDQLTTYAQPQALLSQKPRKVSRAGPEPPGLAAVPVPRG